MTVQTNVNIIQKYLENELSGYSVLNNYLHSNDTVFKISHNNIKQKLIVEIEFIEDHKPKEILPLLQRLNISKYLLSNPDKEFILTNKGLIPKFAK